MTGYRPGIYWQFTWRFLAPIIMVCILLSSIASMFIKKPTYSAWDASRVRKTFWVFEFSLLSLSNFLIRLDLDISFCTFQGIAVPTAYPGWVLAIAVVIIFAGIAPIPIVFLLRRFQCVKLDVDIHQGSIRRIDTTVSTKEMMGDVDVSRSRKSLTAMSSFQQHPPDVPFILHYSLYSIVYITTHAFAFVYFFYLHSVASRTFTKDYFVRLKSMLDKSSNTIILNQENRATFTTYMNYIISLHWFGDSSFITSLD